jgi:electron transfer flavoprotein beta subunit
VKNGVTPDDFKYPEAEGGRYASLKGIMAAKKKPVEETALAALGVKADKSVEYTKFELPPARSGNTVFVESVEELVQKLHTVAKVI